MAFTPNYLLFISCFMFLWVWVAANAISHHPPPSPPPYAIVAMQWPMAVCKLNLCFNDVPVRKEFRIHGVWPQDGIKCPTHDQHMPYSYEVVKNTHDIERLWPSFYNKDNDKFWEHEWTKHGSCSGKSLKDYFEASVELFSQEYEHVLKALEHHGIKPNGSSYPVKSFRDAISEEHKITPIIHCEGDYLLEIRLCAMFDLKGYLNCTGVNLSSGCSKAKDPVFYASATTPGVSAY